MRSRTRSATPSRRSQRRSSALFTRSRTSWHCEAEMDAEALERVLDAMMDVPVNIDKRALRDDLGSAGSMFRTTRELDSTSLAKKRFRRVRDMQTTAKKLA